MALPEYTHYEHLQMALEDYLLLDQGSKTARYEYIDGDVYMLAGGSPDHALIAANLMGIFYGALRKTPCVAYTSDVHVQLSESRYVHPDVAVTCDERDANADRETPIKYPRIVVEVLSPSTEMIDRIKKLEYYRQCPTIEDYLLVDSRKVAVDHYHREGNKWIWDTYKQSAEIELPNLAMQISLQDIYEKTRLIRRASFGHDI